MLQVYVSRIGDGNVVLTWTKAGSSNKQIMQTHVSVVANIHVRLNRTYESENVT